ncbi:MAG: phage late control D family protein, partial [candidate division Zixibacteria bacterium]|nr:phage late control D family protein [candidate division Zixibacteria bacterium]
MAYDFKIKVADQEIDREFLSSVSSIKLDQYVDRHHVLKIELHGLGAEADLSEFSGTQEFSGFLGETISLKVETDEVADEPRPITAMEFIGVVTEVRHENTVDMINSITITAHSPTNVMDGPLRNKLYHDMKASEIITQVLNNHPITVGSVASTEAQLAHCVQYRESDFQFVMRLAGLSGLFAYYDGSEFTVGKAAASSSDVELTFRQMLFEFKMGLGTRTEKFAAQSYDQVRKEVYDGETSGSLQTSISGLAKLSHDASKNLYPEGSFVSGLKPDSQSSLDKSIESAREASVGRMVHCSGRSRDPRLKIGACVKISGMPSDFHGPHWIKS